MAKVALKQIADISGLAQIAQDLAGIDLGALTKQPQIQSIKLNLIGNISPLIGTAKWSPPSPVTINTAYFILGGVDITNVTLRIKKNNNAFFDLSAAAGQFKSTILAAIAGNLTVLDSDFITVDVVQAASSSNLTLILEYQTWVQ